MIANSFREWHLRSYFKMDNCFVFVSAASVTKISFSVSLSPFIHLKLSIVALEMFRVLPFILHSFFFSEHPTEAQMNIPTNKLQLK